MEIKKRVIVPAALLEETHTLYPLWDERVVFKKDLDEYFGDKLMLVVENVSKPLIQVNAIFNMKTKSLELPTELDIYPKRLEFKKGETVYTEYGYRKLCETSIKDIVYEEFFMLMRKGKNLEGYNIDPTIKIEPEELYTLKTWKPFYLLENGIKVEHSYQIYGKSDIKKG